MMMGFCLIVFDECILEKSIYVDLMGSYDR